MDVALISLVVITAINGYWTWQSRKIQNDREVIKSLQFQLDLKERAVQDMRKAKNEMKTQYHHVLRRAERAEAELKTYKKFHNHPET